MVTKHHKCEGQDTICDTYILTVLMIYKWICSKLKSLVSAIQTQESYSFYFKQTVIGRIIVYFMALSFSEELFRM